MSTLFQVMLGIFMYIPVYGPTLLSSAWAGKNYPSKKGFIGSMIFAMVYVFFAINLERIYLGNFVEWVTIGTAGLACLYLYIQMRFENSH